MARGASKARGLNSALARMFAAVSGAGVWHQNAHLIFWNTKHLRQLALHPKGPLRARPDRELAVFPLGHGGARLERRVGDVGDIVGLLRVHVRTGYPLFDGAEPSSTAAPFNRSC